MSLNSRSINFEVHKVFHAHDEKLVLRSHVALVKLCGSGYNQFQVRIFLKIQLRFLLHRGLEFTFSATLISIKLRLSIFWRLILNLRIHALLAMAGLLDSTTYSSASISLPLYDAFTFILPSGLNNSLLYGRNKIFVGSINVLIFSFSNSLRRTSVNRDPESISKKTGCESTAL